MLDCSFNSALYTVKRIHLYLLYTVDGANKC